MKRNNILHLAPQVIKLKTKLNVKSVFVLYDIWNWNWNLQDIQMQDEMIISYNDQTSVYRRVAVCSLIISKIYLVVAINVYLIFNCHCICFAFCIDNGHCTITEYTNNFMYLFVCVIKSNLNNSH